MSFYDRYVELCSMHDMKPQCPEMLKVTEVSSGAISGWKKGSLPKGDVLCRLANYFDVTTDYLLGLSELRSPQLSMSMLSGKEQLLINTYRMADDEGQMNIIYVCMDEKRKAEAKGKSTAAV